MKNKISNREENEKLTASEDGIGGVFDRDRHPELVGSANEPADFELDVHQAARPVLRALLRVRRVDLLLPVRAADRRSGDHNRRSTA